MIYYQESPLFLYKKNQKTVAFSLTFVESCDNNIFLFLFFGRIWYIEYI